MGAPFRIFLFGSKDLAGLERVCIVCGVRFLDVARATGRHRRLCSEQCRRRRKAAQVAAWRSDHAPQTCEIVTGNCRRCGAPFAVSRGRGRAPTLCGKGCRRAIDRDRKRGAGGAQQLDLAIAIDLGAPS